MQKARHLIDAMPRPHGKQAVWEAALARGEEEFTFTDIWYEVNHLQREGETHKETVRQYLRSLCRAGIASSRKDGNERYYTIVKNTGPVAPAVRRDGTLAKAKKGTQRMWRALRILNVFNYRELAYAAEVSETTAETYTRLLCKAGYLVVAQEAKHDAAGGLQKYRFVAGRNTGPHAPQIQKVKSVYDPNTCEVVWPPAEDETSARANENEETVDA